MRLLLLIASVIAALGCSACSTTLEEQQVDWGHGARRGLIVGSYDAATPAAELPPCLARLPSTELARHRYVRVAYHHVRLNRVAVAALPDALAAGPGDAVELWPRECAQGELARITRLLPTP